MHNTATMKALVYHGPNYKILENVPKPEIVQETDAIVKITTTAICGTDMHIVRGELLKVKPRTILGREGVGIIEAVGEKVKGFDIGDRVIVSAITSCGVCHNCIHNFQSQCEIGGGLLGATIDGTHAEYVRIPHATHSLVKVPKECKLPEKQLVLLSSILPTGYEIGALNGQISSGDRVAIIGAGPIGLSVLLTCQKYKPKEIIVIDYNEKRLNKCTKMGATKIVNPFEVEDIVDVVNNVDVVMECAGTTTAFNTCQKIVGPGGRISNVGIHTRPVEFKIDEMWMKNVTVTTGLVSGHTTKQLLYDMMEKKIQPGDGFVSHVFTKDDFVEAYYTFEHAAETGATKVVIEV